MSMSRLLMGMKAFSVLLFLFFNKSSKLLNLLLRGHVLQEHPFSLTEFLFYFVLKSDQKKTQI